MERTTTETIVAIIVGVVLGTLVAISIWLVKTGRINLNFTQSISQTVGRPTPTPRSQDSPSTLLISQPSDESVVSEAKIVVAGKTAVSATVLVSQNNQDTVGLSDKDGIFKINITLDEGDNEITVTSINQNGQSKQQLLTVVYKK